MAFRLPTHVSIASGCFNQLPYLVDTYGKGRVLLVFDHGLAQTPWPDQAAQMLTTRGHQVITFDGVEVNPHHATVDNIAHQAIIDAIDVVVGLGGGSVIDAAKAVSMLVHNPGSCVDYEGRNRFEKPPLPLIAVPTTCGTGSEVTWVSVINNVDEQRKMSIKGDLMFPNVALVDPDLLTTLPSSLVAYTGLDALTHALEAYVSLAANPITDTLAEKAIVLIMNFLRWAVSDISGDSEAREAVMRASTLAGMAFGNADVGAVHCLSETVGSIWNVPHGLGNAIFLVPVLKYQLQYIRDKLNKLFTLVLPSSSYTAEADAERMIELIEQLSADIKIPSFQSLGIAPEFFPRIASEATKNNSNPSNPRPMHEEDYLSILQQMPP